MPSCMHLSSRIGEGVGAVRTVRTVRKGKSIKKVIDRRKC